MFLASFGRELAKDRNRKSQIRPSAEHDIHYSPHQRLVYLLSISIEFREGNWRPSIERSMCGIAVLHSKTVENGGDETVLTYPYSTRTLAYVDIEELAGETEICHFVLRAQFRFYFRDLPDVR